MCDNQVIAGFCAIQENEENYEINHFWIKPEAMGKGYGKRLLQYILDQVVIKSKPVEIVSDPHAEYFYKRFGFVTTDQVESTPGGRYLPVMVLMKESH